jgi:hypothetical protein
MENVENFKITEDLRQSPEYGKYMEKIGWTLRQAQGKQIFIRKLGLVSIVKIQRTKVILPMREVEKVLKDNRAILCKIEPAEGVRCEGLKAKGYKLSTWPLLGTKTLRVDLKPVNEEIFNSLKKDSRYILRKIYNLKL